MLLKTKDKNINNLNDETLMQYVCNGHTAAFNIIYNRYKNRLLYYFYRMLGNSNELAQDFLQETFMKIIDKPRLFDPAQKFSTWIFSVAHNMCKNEYRKREVRKNTYNEGCLDIYPSFNTSKHTTKLVDHIYYLINKFNDEHKSCFLLKYREGFTVAEISETLSISEGTVKSRLFYTRKKLEDEIRKQFPEELDEYLYNTIN